MKLALTAVALLLAATAGSVRAGAVKASELVFVRGQPSSSDLWAIREDGTGLRRLTRTPGGEGHPQFSPDGSRIVFSSTRDGDDELFAMDADGRNVRRLTRNRRADVTPSWSPDGRWIAFASDRARPGEHEIWLVRSDGTGARRLVATRNHRGFQDAQFSPTWSPDGRRLIFSMTVADGNPELFVVGVNGKGLKRLTFTRGSVDVFGDDTMPEWSSDGRTVLFVSNRERRNSDVWTMNADGSRQRPVVRRANDDWSPRRSRDGGRIAFTQLLPNGAQSVWVMNADGSAPRRITSGSEADWR
jgi:TolB protein